MNQIQAYQWKGWKVYKISFPDGYEYVGITVYDIETRIRGHLYRPVNAELKRRLETMPYEWEILADNLKDMSEAYALEQVYIDRLQKPININGVDPRKRVNFGHEQTDYNKGRKRRKRTPRLVTKPRTGHFRCSCCGEVYPAEKFRKDTSRFNGLDSRCRPCNILTINGTATKEQILENREFYHKIYEDMQDRKQRTKDAKAFAKKWQYQEYLPPPKRIGKPYGKDKTLHWAEVTTAVPRADGTLYITQEYVRPRRFSQQGCNVCEFTRYLINTELNLFLCLQAIELKYGDVNISHNDLRYASGRVGRTTYILLKSMVNKGFLYWQDKEKRVLYPQIIEV